VCYLAFQAGYYALAAKSVQAFDEAESVRLAGARERYVGALRDELLEHPQGGFIR
jgi:hypothetical protein